MLRHYSPCNRITPDGDLSRIRCSRATLYRTASTESELQSRMTDSAGMRVLPDSAGVDRSQLLEAQGGHGINAGGAPRRDPDAKRATAVSRSGVAMKAVGSSALTPKRKLARKRVSQNAPPMPMTTPIEREHHALADDHVAEIAACAPSAMRMPSSCVRCWTE